MTELSPVLSMLLLAACAGLLVALLAARRRGRRLATELRVLRAEGRAVAEVLDLWQWRSDAAHRLIELRPPGGADAAAWSRSSAATGQPMQQHFRADDAAALQALLDARAPIADLHVTCASPDGEAAPARLRAVARLGEDGRFAGYVGTLRPLETVPTAAVAPPDTPVDTLTRGDTDPHDSFAYTVSHDLRAPIRVVEGFAKILKEDYGRLLDRVGNDHLDRVLGAAHRMHHMIDALLALSRLSNQALVREPVNLSQLAGYVADDLRRQSPERAVRLHIEPDLHANGDPTLLRVMLENLLGNAWKYTARCAEPQIWFERDRGAADGGFVVRDNGAGFDMRFADRLFSVFQRLHSASEFQGTGVGLASVRRIVRRHGGDIRAEAEVDRGARFHFSLGPPAVPAHSSGPKEPVLMAVPPVNPSAVVTPASAHDAATHAAPSPAPSPLKAVPR